MREEWTRTDDSRPGRDWMLFVTLVLVPFLGLEIAWLIKDQTPQITDAGWTHLPRALSVFYGLRDHPSDWADYLLRNRHDYGLLNVPLHPPFNYIVTLPFFAALGPSVAAARAALVLFATVALASVFSTGRAVAGTPAGLAAAGILAASPTFRAFTGQYYNDLPLLCMVALSVACALHTGGMARRGPSLALGLAGGCGMITKMAFPLFFAPLVLLTAVQGGWAIRKRVLHPGEFLLNAGLSVLIFCAVAGPWWVTNWGGVRSVGVELHGQVASGVFAHQVDQLSRVLGALAFCHVPPPFLLALFGAAVGFPAYARSRPLAWFILAFLLLSSVALAQSYLDARYVLPLTAVSAVAIVGWWPKQGFLAKLLTGAVLLWSVCTQAAWLVRFPEEIERNRPDVRSGLCLMAPADAFSREFASNPWKYPWLGAAPGREPTDLGRMAADVARWHPGREFTIANPLEIGSGMSSFSHAAALVERGYLELGKDAFAAESHRDLFVVLPDTGLDLVAAELAAGQFAEVGRYDFRPIEQVTAVLFAPSTWAPRPAPDGP